LKAGLWFRRGRLLIVSPGRGHSRRLQADIPLIDMSRFAEPLLCSALTYTALAGICHHP
jgi:hypothetical protein